MKIKLIFLNLFFLFSFIAVSCFSQPNVRVQLTDTTHDAAYNFLLDANRPYPDLGSDMVSKGKFSADFSASLNEDYKEFSVSGTYGLNDQFNLTGTMVLLTSNYNLSSAKVNGVGDFLIASRFLIGSGEYFSHLVQGAVKIPIAKSGNQLGTGKLDYHLGFVENYYNENFSCDLSASFDVLSTPDFPTAKTTIIEKEIDSVKGRYTFTTQNNYSVAIYPTYYINDDFSLSTGADFTRDMQLNYNSSTFYLGFGLNLSPQALLSVGSSFNILNSAGYYLSADLSLDL